jgi:UDP-MurNAc hydroxylase
MSANQQDLRVRATIPFASLMYFSSVDNRLMNVFANRPHDAVEFCAARGQRVDVLYPGDEYEVNEEYDSSRALARYR